MTRDRLLRLISVIAFLAIIILMAVAGWRFRRWAWEQTAKIHYAPDMTNAWRWGSRADKDGYFALYDRVVAESPNHQYGLDYVPLRLAVMTAWAHWAREKFPGANEWRRDYEFNAPLLRVNAAMELAAAAGLFFLVRQWIRKEHESPPTSLFAKLWRRWRAGRSVESAIDLQSSPTPFRFMEGCWLALLAAGLVWFNPSSVFSAHGRPTWDVWVIPFYVWAIFFAGRNNWFLAGVIVGVGTMLKGQQLIVAPFFLLWPIFSLRFGAMTRWLIGFALAAGLIVSPWLVWQTPQWGPLLICAGAGAIGPALYVVARNLPSIRAWASVRAAMWISGFSLALAIGCTPVLFHVSLAWLQVGFVYGVDKMPALESGGASSLAGVLQNRYGWSCDTLVGLPFTHATITMKSLLVAIGYAMIAIAAATAAWHGRNRDRRFLLAVAAPWLIYFAVFPQMHERYLLWAALMTAVAAAFGPGMIGLHLLLTAFSWIMGINQMLRDSGADNFGQGISPTFGRSLYDFTQNTIPDSAWATMLICVIWLWMMFSPSVNVRLGRRGASAAARLETHSA